MNDISDIASRLAKAYAVREAHEVESLYTEARGLAGEEAARRAIVEAFATLAGRARADGNHSAVCRLLGGIYTYQPESMRRVEVRELLKAHKAVGHVPKAPDLYPRRLSMLAATKDSSYA